VPPEQALPDPHLQTPVELSHVLPCVQDAPELQPAIELQALLTQ
jgi:hypothetical protein